MSTDGAVVDIMIRPEELNLPWSDFSERIMEPAFARLRHHLKLGADDATVSIRVIARGLTQEQLDWLAELCERDQQT